MKHNFFLLIICLVLFTTCKKYPEGGWHYNYLKHLNGNWSLKLYEVDGIDSTLLTQGNNSIPNYLQDFAHFASVHSGKRAQISLNSYSVNYTVYINNKYRDVLQLYNNGSGSQTQKRNIFTPTDDQYFNWEIKKLTKSELILESTPYNYKLILIKK